MLQYRKCSAIFLMKSNLVFAGERSDTPGAWQIPQGGIGQNEEHMKASMRELYEETGITSVKFVKKTSGFYRYNFTDEVQKNVQKKNGGIKYTGQEVVFFVFDFLGEDSEVNLSIGQHQEFSNWKWMNLKELLDSLIDFKKESFELAAKELFQSW